MESGRSAESGGYLLSCCSLLRSSCNVINHNQFRIWNVWNDWNWLDFGKRRGEGGGGIYHVGAGEVAVNRKSISSSRRLANNGSCDWRKSWKRPRAQHVRKWPNEEIYFRAPDRRCRRYFCFKYCCFHFSDQVKKATAAPPPPGPPPPPPLVPPPPPVNDAKMKKRLLVLTVDHSETHCNLHPPRFNDALM